MATKLMSRISHSVQRILVNFAGLVLVILQTSHSQIGVGSAAIWLFLSLYPPKTLNAIFSKVHFSKFALYMIVFKVLSSDVPCILLEHVIMGSHYSILWKTPNSSDISNIFLERIAYNLYFLQHSVLSEPTFPFQCIISKIVNFWSLLVPLSV